MFRFDDGMRVELAEARRLLALKRRLKPDLDRIVEEARGIDHPDLAYPASGPAMLYKKQSRYADSEALFQRALDVRVKAFGLRHLEIE